MKNILLANIGNRDVKLDGKEVKPARERGKEIYNNFDECNQKISLPILTPAIEYIQGSGERLDEIHLFVTDQDNENYRKNDTVEFGKIIKNLISNSKDFPSAKVKLHTIKDQPNYYDNMFAYYQNELKKMEEQFANSASVFVLTTSGTPACNTALLFHSIAVFRNKVANLYVSESRQGKVDKLYTSDQLTKHYQKQSLINFIENYDYSASSAVDLAKSNTSTRLKLLVGCANLRLSFDFEKARKFIRELFIESSDLQTTLRPIKSHLEKLSNENSDSLIKELLLNIEVKYKRREYVDMLGRLFRLDEAILGGEIKKGLKIDVNDSKEFKNGIEQNEELKKHFNNKGKEKIKYDNPNRRNMREVVCFLAKNESESGVKDKLNRVLEVSKQLDKASDLRNKSIIAHGFQGISENDIKDLDIESIIGSIKNVFNFNLESISFDKMNELIRNELESL